MNDECVLICGYILSCPCQIRPTLDGWTELAVIHLDCVRTMAALHVQESQEAHKALNSFKTNGFISRANKITREW